MFSGSSNFVESVDTAFWIIVAISVVLMILVTGLMIYFVFKYSKKRNPKAVNIHGNIPLEITWTVIPTLIVLGMFWISWVGYQEMSNIPKDAYTIDVTAQMWQWKFHYKNGVQTDTLYVPVSTPVQLNLKSLDVNHAFFIPAFRVKKDVYFNRENRVWFEPTEVGSYDIACAEYCGMRHSYMYTKINVLPKDDFEKWLSNVSRKDSTAGSTASTAPDSLAAVNDTTARQ